VAAEAATVLETGDPQLVHFGVSDDRAWAVGLSCGGQIEVFIESLDRPS
jgi:xanthine/CO dehydrogenase XdhC/CoxF family maturation factor